MNRFAAAAVPRIETDLRRDDAVASNLACFEQNKFEVANRQLVIASAFELEEFGLQEGLQEGLHLNLCLRAQKSPSVCD